MSREALTPTAAQPAGESTFGLLQRKCDCGNKASTLNGECEECQAKTALGLQARLAIGASDDPLEREADRAAAQVLSLKSIDTGITRIAPVVTRRSIGNQANSQSIVPDSVYQTLRSPGEQLTPSLRAQFEPRFGHDFSRVRVHRESTAADSANAINAQAYTVGSNIVFGSGQFAPETTTGRELLAHELAHVVQQSRSASLIQRRGGNRGKEAATSQPASPDDRREFATEAANFLRGQGDFFAHQPNRSLDEILGLLRPAAENGLAAIENIPNADAIADEVRAAYRDAVRTILISRTRGRPDDIRTPPTLQQLYEDNRDSILPFGIPHSQANPGGNQLSAELTGALPADPTPEQRTRHRAITRARQHLRVVTSAVSMEIQPLFDTQGARMTIRLPPNTSARFSDNVATSLYHGLGNVAAQLVNTVLTENTTVMLALDLVRFGAGFDSYRFTRIDLGRSLGTEVLIEKQGSIGVEGLRAEEREQMRARFDGFGFRRGSGFGQDEFDQVLIGLSQTPDAQLTMLGGLRFERDSVDRGNPAASAHYDQTDHALRVFDRAFGGGLTRAGNGARPISRAAASVVHEIGHALDLNALRTTAATTETAQQALLDEFGTGGTNFRIPDPRDPERERFDTLNNAVRAAQSAESSASSISGARWSQGATAEVIDRLRPGARQPAFRSAAINDGANAGTGQGFPTTYPNPDSYWQEYFAESFMLYQTSPQTLQNLRPHVFAFMQQEFPR